TIVMLAIGILWVAPPLSMPAITPFTDGSGPVFSGSLFPFLFITIACGAVSGFHSLVASGTTPKMLERESHIPLIGYGAMLTESFVAIMALVAACVLEPGIYFAMNSPAALIGTTTAEAAQKIAERGFCITPPALDEMPLNIRQTALLSRGGGAGPSASCTADIFTARSG